MFRLIGCSLLALPASSPLLGQAQTKELTLWTHWAAEQIKRQYVEEAIADFEKKNPGVKIKASWYEKNALYAALKTALRAGQAPDIFYAEPDQSEYYENSFLLDLSNLNWAKIEPWAKAGVELQGQALRPAARSLDGRALLQQEADERARRDGAGESAALRRRLPRHGEEGEGQEHHADVARQRRPAVHRRAPHPRGPAAEARARRLRQAPHRQAALDRPARGRHAEMGAQPRPRPACCRPPSRRSSSARRTSTSTPSPARSPSSMAAGTPAAPSTRPTRAASRSASRSGS